MRNDIQQLVMVNITKENNGLTHFSSNILQGNVEVLLTLLLKDVAESR